MKCYQSHVDELRAHLTADNEYRCVAKQLLHMHEEVSARANPIVVELGVNTGNSTKMFLNAIDDKPAAKLVSIDICDFSHSAESDRWTFAQQDSTDVTALIEKAPFLKNGIDVLYVDSLHTAEHVKKEVYGYYPYLNKGAVIFFDDVDSAPYMQGQRKDSIETEIANRSIFKLLSGIFRANIEQIDFTVMYGSTGLGRFDKLVSIGKILAEPALVAERDGATLFSRVFSSFQGGKTAST